MVVLIGDNRPAWVFAEIAVQAAGAMSLGVYRDALEQEVAYLIDYAKAKVVIAEDEEQVDKILNLGDGGPLGREDRLRRHPRHAEIRRPAADDPGRSGRSRRRGPCRAGGRLRR